MHAGRNIYIIQQIPGSLYEFWGESVKNLKTYQPGTNLLLAGPYWLLQLWLNATFVPSLPTHNTINEEDEDIKIRKLKGTHMVHLIPNDEGPSLQASFSGYMMMFAKCYNITPSLAPFTNKTHVPEWSTKEFPASSIDQEAESLDTWETFFIPKLISSRLRPLKNR